MIDPDAFPTPSGLSLSKACSSFRDWSRKKQQGFDKLSPLGVGGRVRAVLAALAALILSTPAHAYWDFGHRTIASIAWGQLSPSARAQVRRLIARSAELETPTCPIRSLEEASVWADCIKDLGPRFDYAFPWHFQNVDVCKPYDVKPACPFGACVSNQVSRNAKLLADKTLPARERLQALAFLVHFVGDLHQPLHAGDHGDLGGNKLGTNYGIAGGRANAHAIWDGYLAERAITTPPPDPLADIADRAGAAAGTIEDWGRENWEVARDHVYTPLLGDPCAPTPGNRVTMTDPMIEAAIPVLRRQVARGGLRLARLIEEAL